MPLTIAEARKNADAEPWDARYSCCDATATLTYGRASFRRRVASGGGNDID